MPEPQQELQDLGWCIVELMGHSKLGAKVREAALFGVVLLRADIPVQVPEGEPEKWMTQFCGGGAIFRLTPTTEELARAIAYRYTQPPVSRYELMPARENLAPTGSFGDDKLDAEEIEDDTPY